MFLYCHTRLILCSIGVFCIFDHGQYISAEEHGRAGACPGFLKGGGPISLGSLKKRSSDFKRGGSNGLKGGVQYICLTRTTNLAYLDAKECTNMYFEPLISVKCCPKLHIKQLRTIYITFVCEIGLGWKGGGVTDEKGGSRKRGGSGPPDPPLWTRL